MTDKTDKKVKKKYHYQKKGCCMIKKILEQNPIENVFVHWTSEDLYNPVVILIGPKNTPYENGFYGIKFKFTNKFPFEPPKAAFVTTDGKVRMNPNLYACGKKFVYLF